MSTKNLKNMIMLEDWLYALNGRYWAILKIN